jgi:hypothetical protein
VRPDARRSRVQGMVTACGNAPRRGRTRATSAPRCGQSLGDGPAASEYGVGARWPVKTRCAVERCVKSSWLIDRMIAKRSVRIASLGKCSLIRRPGVRVAIVRKLPRISAGASGLGSQVSSWLGPPHMKISRQDRARPNPAGPAATARLRYNWGSPSPAIASVPAHKASRRDGLWSRNSRQPPRWLAPGSAMASSGSGSNF